MSREYQRGVLVAIVLLLCGSAYGQKMERKNLREGNRYYQKNHYTEAEIAYRKSFETNPTSYEGAYNLGNALYKQNKLPEAAEQYLSIARESRPTDVKSAKEKQQTAEIFHNLGNIQMQNKDYAKSIELYKQSLRFNPKDDETRYNLALAQKLLEDQEGQDQDQDQQQEQQQQDQQDQEQQQQEQPQEQQPEENKTQEQQQENEQMSRDNAQQLLDAFLQDEKNTQEKVKKAQEQKQLKRRIIEKQW